jgi:hypothetical protein
MQDRGTLTTDDDPGAAATQRWPTRGPGHYMAPLVNSAASAE